MQNDFASNIRDIGRKAAITFCSYLMEFSSDSELLTPRSLKVRHIYILSRSKKHESSDKSESKASVFMVS